MRYQVETGVGRPCSVGLGQVVKLIGEPDSALKYTQTTRYLHTSYRRLHALECHFLW